MNRLWISLLCSLLMTMTAGLPLAAESATSDSQKLVVSPSAVSLQGRFSRAQLVVTAADATGAIDDRSEDLTHTVEYQSSDPNVVEVSPNGALLAIGNGHAQISVKSEQHNSTVSVKVAEVAKQSPISFTEEVMPILSKAGCNMGACHASQYGQGGFKLSVFGFQPKEDRAAVVRDRHGRRVNFLDPEKSLLVQKPTLLVPHGGSRRLETGSVDHQILVEWIKQGAPGPQKDAPHVTGLQVFPNRRVGSVDTVQQLRVEAEFSNGTTRDVTAWAKFDSMDEALLDVEPDGRVTTTGKGQAPVMVRFEGRAEIAMFVMPYSESVPLAGWKENNFVDQHAAVKFRELGIEPSPLCDDATFVRRAYFDAVGSQPTVDETKQFIESVDPKKRDKLIDRLLGYGDETFHDRYAAYWTLKWSDLIRNRSDSVGEQGMWAMHNWLKKSFRTNKPFDQFVSELVTAQGSIYSQGPANYFRIHRGTSQLAESTAQLFMGIRIQCAKCHHHPFEKYSQDDYNGFAKFFSRVSTKSSQEFGLFGRESVVVVKPVNGATANTLDGETVAHERDLRISLVEWMTSPKNEYFANSIVNRYVSYLLGRGLVEPVDDMRDTNPPTNVALLDALSAAFVESGYDVKQLIRTLMQSRLYQLDSQPTPANASDDRFYSHYKVKRISAEPLLDAIVEATSVPSKFKNVPPGTRAIELPDAKYPNYFLTTFGKPPRASVCECERVPDETLAQALHTLNGDTLTGKIADKKGRVARLLNEKKPHDSIVEELYLSTLCRYPSEQEREAGKKFLEESPSPAECYEDLMWALVNSKQFLFIR